MTNRIIEKYYRRPILAVTPPYPKMPRTHISRKITCVEYGYKPLHNKSGKPIPYHRDLFSDLNRQVYGNEWKPGDKVMRADEFKSKITFCYNCRGKVRAWTHSDMDYWVCDRCTAKITKDLDWKKTR